MLVSRAMDRHFTASRARQRGTSLIEVLVSLVVTSIGVLSLGSLEVMSKRNLREAGQRLQAAQLAYSLLERMRANSSSDALKAYITRAAPAVGGTRLGDTAPSPNCYAGTSCSPSQLAAFDLWLWEQLLDGSPERIGAAGTKAGGLSLPTACLAAPAAGAGQAGLYTLTIAFRGDRPLPSNGGVTCGQGAVFSDGTKLYGDQGQYRRTVVVQAYIVPAVAK
jgi:type IV pilus assembly protein PilV